MNRLAWICVLFLVTTASGQPKLTLTIDRAILSVGESTNLTIVLSGASNSEKIQLPSMQYLQVVAGPHKNTSYEIVNGRASTSVSWTYRLRAVSPGREQVGPLRIKAGGQILSSNAVTVNITAGTATQNSRDSNESPTVFIRVAPDKTQIYYGEQVTLTYRIFFAAQISQPEIAKMPAATGFWVEELNVPQNQTLTDEVVGGRAYKVGILKKVALFPTTIGELAVEPMLISTKVQRETRRRSRDPFDIFSDPFFSLGPQLEPVEVESPRVTIRVRSLPDDAVPPDFAGAVGSFTVRTHLDKPVASTDEAVTLTVVVEGTGNIKTLSEPKVMFPPGLEPYDPRMIEDIRRDQQRIGGTKRFDYVVIARAPGEHIIPPVRYVFFDPTTNNYVVARTTELTLNVEKGPATATGGGISVVTKRGIESIATDIAFIKTQGNRFTPHGKAPHQLPSLWLMAASPWVALVGLLLVVRQQRSGGNSKRSTQSMFKKARWELVQAEKAFKAGNVGTSCRYVSLSLHSVAEAMLLKPQVDFFDPDLPREWRSAGLDPALLEQMQDIERTANTARFAPALVDKTSVPGVLRRARAVIRSAGGQDKHTTV